MKTASSFVPCWLGRPLAAGRLLTAEGHPGLPPCSFLRLGLVIKEMLDKTHVMLDKQSPF